MIRFATEELSSIDLVKPHEILDGFVVREKDSYPVYYVGHRPLFETIKSYVDGLENVTLIGRGGMYKYNDQDHSILTGLLAARKYLGESHDIGVSTPTKTIMKKNTSTGRAFPQTPARPSHLPTVVESIGAGQPPLRLLL